MRPSPTQAPLENPYHLWRSWLCTDMYVSPSFVPSLPTVADIIQWIFYCFSTYPSDALRLSCIFNTATRSHRHASVTTIVPLPSQHRPLSTSLSVYGGRQDQSIAKYGQSRQLSAQQQAHAILVTLTSTTITPSGVT